MEMAHSVLNVLVCLTLETNVSQNSSSQYFTAFARASIPLVLALKDRYPSYKLQFVERFFRFTGFSSAIGNYEFSILVWNCIVFPPASSCCCSNFYLPMSFSK